MSARPKEPLPLHEKKKKAATVHPAIKAIAGKGRHGVEAPYRQQSFGVTPGLHVQGLQVDSWRHAACNPWTPSRPDFSLTRSSNTMVGAAAFKRCNFAAQRSPCIVHQFAPERLLMSDHHMTSRANCSGIVHCGKTVYTEEGLRALWKGLTPFAAHLTLKYALRMGTNAAYQSALRDEVRPRRPVASHQDL